MTYSPPRNYFVRTPRRRLITFTIFGVLFVFFGLNRLDTLWLRRDEHPAEMLAFLVGLGLGLIGFPLFLYLLDKGGAAKSAGVSLLVVLALLVMIALPTRSTNEFFGPVKWQLVGDGIMTALGALIIVGLNFRPRFRARLQIPEGPPSRWGENHMSTGGGSAPDVSPSKALAWLSVEEFRVALRGYNISAVDRFIEDVVWRSQTGSVTAHELRVQEFPPALKGYNMDDVDHALERAAKQLAAE